MPAREIITDEQTGQAYPVVPEGTADVLAAWISAAYSILAIAFLAWLLLDTWSGEYSFWSRLLTAERAKAAGASNLFRLIVYTAAGGGIGAAVNNLRSFIQWHAERQAFGWRFVWKHLALPPLGATLAVLVYGILQGGMAVFNGGAVAATSITALSAWATGTLAGYGSHNVFVWLDDKVNTLFKVDAKKVAVPDVIGKSPDEAKKALTDSQLKAGDTTEEETTDTQKIGTVIGQNPAAGTEILCNSKVALVVGVKAAEGKPIVPDANLVTLPEPAEVAAGNGHTD